MTRYTIITFCLGFWIGITPGLISNYFTLSDKNQKIKPKVCEIVYGYWSKDGVLELIKED